MNLLKKGPEIKLSSLKPSSLKTSQIKVPQVLSDLYWDLRDRYLLPAVIVLIVAIVAVPLVLGGGSDSDWQSELAETELTEEVATSSATPSTTGELVAKATPGLRDYHRRLRNLKETDPFVQRFSESEGSTVAPSGEEVSSTVAPTSESTAAPEETSLGTPGGSPPAEPEDDSPQLAWFSYAIDVRVVAMGEAGGAAGRASASAAGGREQVTTRRNLPELTVLPNRGTPAAIYMGVTKDGAKALLMLSDRVQGIFGDGTCVLGSTTCQLLAIEPGLPVTIVYGPAERTFRIELLKLRLLRSDKLNRAPLGSGKDKQQKKSTEGLAQLAPRP
ncbi:MAG TPA: hypothetical protein VFX85_10660 [Solirubrobacterales bacterium]|nr:hypothetical protein [Solirubrobacterales bacterium]